jgi:hypothetical protein
MGMSAPHPVAPRVGLSAPPSQCRAAEVATPGEAHAAEITAKVGTKNIGWLLQGMRDTGIWAGDGRQL